MDENKQKEAVEFVKKQWEKVAQEVNQRLDKEALSNWVKDVDTRVQRNLFPQFPVDVIETKDAYIVRAQLLGASKDNVDVRVSGNRLRIVVTLAPDTAVLEEGSRFLRKEIGRQPLERVLRFNLNIDEKEVKASFEEGILELVLPVIPEDETKVTLD
ncbi:MAG: Hsp20/alpha crystallin family protein [Bacilli bacterium]